MFWYVAQFFFFFGCQSHFFLCTVCACCEINQVLLCLIFSQLSYSEWVSEWERGVFIIFILFPLAPNKSQIIWREDSILYEIVCYESIEVQFFFLICILYEIFLLLKFFMLKFFYMKLYIIWNFFLVKIQCCSNFRIISLLINRGCQFFFNMFLEN